MADVPFSGVLNPVTERVVNLADTYAEKVMADLPSATEDELRRGLAGAFIAFLVEVLSQAA